MIAEAGSNHNRDLGIAKQLIDVAAEAGADAVKFQTYSGNRIYSRKAESKYLAEWTTQDAGRAARGHLAAARVARASSPTTRAPRGIDFFSAPFDHDAVTLLAEVGAPLLKIASGEIVDLPLIRGAAATGLPLIISTGMATLAEIEDAVTPPSRRARRPSA